MDQGTVFSEGLPRINLSNVKPDLAQVLLRILVPQLQTRRMSESALKAAIPSTFAECRKGANNGHPAASVLNTSRMHCRDNLCLDEESGYPAELQHEAADVRLLLRTREA